MLLFKLSQLFLIELFDILRVNKCLIIVIHDDALFFLSDIYESIGMSNGFFPPILYGEISVVKNEVFNFTAKTGFFYHFPICFLNYFIIEFVPLFFNLNIHFVMSRIPSQTKMNINCHEFILLATLQLFEIGTQVYILIEFKVIIYFNIFIIIVVVSKSIELKI